MNNPVIPRDAASIIVYRYLNGELEVLMGKRPSTASFMPGVYVFPGGAVEAFDADITVSTKLDAGVVERMSVGKDVNYATAIANAAVRETFEETGLKIALTGDPGSSEDPSWQFFKEQNLAPHLSALCFFGSAITPPDMSKRFHARFFLCDAGSVEGLLDSPLKGNGELEDLQWVKVSTVQDYPMRSVTVFMLEQFSRYSYEQLQGFTGAIAYN